MCVPADATPINVRSTALSGVFAVVVWDLPPTASGDDIAILRYSVALNFVGANGNTFTVNTNTTRGLMLSSAAYSRYGPSSRVEITVTALYSLPTGVQADASEFVLVVPASGANGKITDYAAFWLLFFFFLFFFLFFFHFLFLTGMACSEPKPKALVNRINFLLVESSCVYNNHLLSCFFLLFFCFFFFLFCL